IVPDHRGLHRPDTRSLAPHPDSPASQVPWIDDRFSSSIRLFTTARQPASLLERPSHQVNAALGSPQTAPAAGALVLALGDGRGQWLVADARVTEIVERVVRNLMFEDEAPDLRTPPGGEHVDPEL